MGKSASENQKDPAPAPGGGEMGDRIRAFDWGKTPLGPMDAWEQSLKTSVSIILNSRYPMFIWWGPELINIYNDGYVSMLGKRHPKALGRRASDIWKDIWDVVGPQADLVMKEGRSTWNEELLLLMERNGVPEETYFTFSYSPIADDRGKIGGLFCAVTEDTGKVIGRRRLKLLRDLGERSLEETRSVEDAVQAAGETLDSDPFDIPFALIYLLDANEARLAQKVRAKDDPSVAPSSIQLGQRGDLWELASVHRTGERRLVDLDETVAAGLEPAAWNDLATKEAVVVPLSRSSKSNAPFGFLICGISPRLRFDDEYAGFVELIAGQISAAISNALSFAEEKARAEALAELDRAKTEFFSNVSHEFRTPLTLALGNLEELSRSEELPRHQRENVDSAHRNSLRLLKLVNNLLDFSRIEAGRAEKNEEPVDLAALTADLAGAFRSAIEAAGLKLIVEAPGPCIALVDREMWEKIVLNLISNAYKFTFSGEIRVSVGETKKGLALEVTDTGVGIPDDQLEKVFERFHRVRSTVGRTHEGTGIGLALVQELVELHGGKISVESKPGVGTTFSVVIPKKAGLGSRTNGGRRSASAKRGNTQKVDTLTEAFVAEALMNGATSGEHVVSEPNGGAGRILLVDDNADMLSYVSRLLRGAGFAVDLAGDGVAALEAAHANLPDLILTDVMMPRMNGFELLDAVRSDETLKEIPIIMLSARAGEESKVEGLDAGADDYLIKPFSANELLSRVRSQLSLRRQRIEAERQVRESAERYRAFIENSSEGIWRFELDEPIATDLPVDEQVALAFRHGYLAECNDAMAKQYGFESSDDVIGMRLGDLLLKDDPNNIEFLRAFVLSGYRLNDAESHERDANGDDRYFLNNFVGIIEEGKLRRAWGSQRDITQTKTEELARSRLAAIVESSEDAIIGLDLERRITSWNKAAERIYGYSAEEILGKPITEVIPEERTGEEHGVFDRVAAGESVDHYETTRRSRDGRLVDVSLTISPILDSSNKVIGVSKIARDISERKHTDRMLIENRLMLSMAMHSSSMGAWERDVASGIITWSEELEAIFGLKKGEFRGTEEHYYQLVYEDDRGAAWHEVEQAVNEHRPYSIEFRFYHADGSIRWMEGRGEAVYSEGGEPVRLYGIGIDITDRKLAEQKIREGEEHFRLALSSGAVTVYEQDLDLRYEWLYPTALYSPEVIGKSDIEFAPGEQGQILTNLKRKVIASGEPLREEIRAEVLGVEHWYDLIIEPRFNESGEIIGVGGTALDITSKWKAESELKRQALLLEAALEPVIVWELGGTIIDWNKGAERLYGYTAAEAIGQTTRELLKTVFPGSYEKVVEELKRDSSWFGELRHTLKSGDTILVESRHQLVNFNGKDLVLESNRDVTEKRRVADELRRSEARLQAMFDSTTVGVAVLDPGGRFLQINDPFCKLTGYSREELLHMGRENLTFPEDAPALDSGLRELFEGQTGHFTFENRYIRKDGSPVWVQNSFSLTRDDHNEPLHLIAITQDITSRKQAEDELEMLSRLPAENPHPVMRISPSGDLLYSNPAARPLLNSWNDGASVSSELLAITRQAFETGSRREIDIDHAGRVFHMTVAPITESGYVNIYGTDITAARTALTALQESEQRFSRFMQQLPGLAWIKDINGRYIYANEAAERSFGIPIEDLFGKNDDEVFSPDSARQFKEHDRLALESGTGRQFLESLVEKDGVLHYSIVSKFPISDASGEPALIGGMAIDVTDQKLAEEELRRRVAFDEAVVTGMGEGLLTTDAQGSVTSLNPAAERLFGWSFEELRGKSVHDFAHYTHRDGSQFPAEECQLLSVLRDGKALINQEDVFIRRDGTFFDVLFSASPLPALDKAAGLVVVFQDISERKRAEEQLERYRHLSEHANDIIWLLKDDGTIVEVNQAAVKAYGYSREELIGMNVADLRHPSRLDEIHEQMAAALAGNIHFETVHKRRDGSPIPVEVNASSAEFNGELLIMSILRDITERKRQERDHEFLLRLAELVRVETDPDMLLQTATVMLGEHLTLDRCFFSTIDLDERTSTIVSEYAAEPFRPLERIAKFDDYSQPNRNAALGGKTITVSDARSDARTSEKYDVSYGPENIRSYVAVPQARDALWAGIFFACRATPHEWSESEISLVQTVSERVWLAAEKLRTEYALRETERRAVEEYQKLLERIVPLAESLGAARDLLTVYRSLQEFISISMECSGFFVSFYDAANQARVPGFIWGEGREIDISSLPPMPVNEEGGPNSRAILSKETVITDNYWEYQRKRPHVVLAENGVDPMSSLVVPMIVQDRVIGTLEVQAHSNNAYGREHAIALEMAANLAAVAIDNVRLIETEARARAEAETANRMKDEFLSVLSHELRTPLNAMLGWVRILRAGNVDEQRMLKALEIIERNTRQQSSLIEDLLDVSRIISGKMRIESEMIDLVPSLEQAAESVRPIAAAKGVEFDISSAREPLYLSGDAVRLQQVFTNLLQNAIKFTSAGGRVALTWQRADSDVVVEVTDTGIGIEPDFLPMIFDRFSQADASTRRHNTGLGLGLTLVRTIVEMHGGVTIAHSDGPGTGAKFTVRLPLAREFYRDEPELLPTLTNGHSHSLEGLRILVVDDDEDGLGPLRLMLENENANVTCVVTAASALERLAGSDFHILISDIGMPSMDGYELISKVRAAGSRNRGIKAIAYTAYASEEDRRRVLESGFQAHLTKPLDMDDLLSIVRSFGSSVKNM